MSTPLSAFGRHGGWVIALMCLLMFTFVISDALMYTGNGGQGSARDGLTVASWNGGSVNERQLDQTVMHRNILAEFQQTVEQMGARAAIDDGVDLQFAGRRVEPLRLPRSREQGVERDVIRTKIFAEKALEAGMVVTDEMIVDYLQAISFDRVSNDDMRTILKRMNSGGGRATIAFVFDLLREAMLANNYLASHTYAFRTILPEERWEDWRKVNERVVLEAAALPTETFLDEVAEPTDEEVQEFYNRYKDREPSPDFPAGYNVELASPLPAFATPPRVKLSYLKADFDAVAGQLSDEVTDEEVAAYYEENKESFVEADRGLFGGDDSIFGTDDLLSEDDDQPADGGDGEGEVAESDDPAMTDEEAEEPTTDAPTDEEPATDDAAEPTEESVNPLRDESPVEEEEEEEEVAETDDTEPAASEDSDPVDEETSADEPTDESDEKEYQPLEDVADEIRRTLAGQRAAQRLQDKMNALRTELNDAYNDYFIARVEAEAEAEANPEAEAPEPPALLTDLKPIAEREQLELVEIDMAPQIELRESEVGRTLTVDASRQQPLPAWFLAFRPDDLDTLEPLLTYDLDGNRYLILVNERYDAESPELDEIRDQVVAAWKRSKAAEIAVERAKELAETITPTGKSLTEYFADAGEDTPEPASIDETDAFALLTIGQVAPTSRRVPLRLSQPEPLVTPGPDLLQAAFELDAGDVTAELNHDHSIAYLLRIAQKIGVEDELRREFLRDGDRWMGAQALMQARVNEKVLALMGTLLDESGLEWERTPDQLR